jgi:hypothetical protein
MDIGEVKAVYYRKPFRPFTINIVDGEQLAIDKDSEILFPRKKPELIIVFAADGTMHLLEAESVASLVTI